MKKLYTLGIDYGSLSARAVICRAADGKIMSEAVSNYAHGVMSSALPCGTPLPPDWALQHPQDYLDALTESVRCAVSQSGVSAQEIGGIGVDFTGSTPLPLGRDGQPLCFDPAFEKEPHAYVKLWKHHGAMREAAELNELAQKYDPQLLACSGGRISPEVFFAKLLQILHESPATFAAIDRFVEAGDWVTQCLTGNEVRSMPIAANKAFYRPGEGYPAFLEECYPALRGMEQTLLRGEKRGLGQLAGYLTPEMAQRLHLCPGTPVATAQLDGHSALPALGIDGAGYAALTVGTSAALILPYPDFRAVEGECGIVYEGSLPGFYGYACGQAGVGDMLSWFVENCVPQALKQQSQARGISVHTLLTEQASLLRPGQSGLLCLDWWNGNRSILTDASLSGLLLGMTLQTTPAEIYRAMLEGLAFGLRRILQAHEEAGIELRALHLAGGISYKNPFFMQLLSDITGKTLRGSQPVSVPAVGAAMFAATAGGLHPSLTQAIRHMNCLSDVVYTPHPQAVYEQLYQEYVTLHDYFGRGGNQVMKRLRAIRQEEEQHDQP